MIDVVAFVDEGLGNSSYLVDLGDGGAVVVDPSRDPTPYLAEADRRGLRIVFTAETHLHADFVSGSRELASLGATILAPAGAELTYSHRALGDDDEVVVGGLTLRAVVTPGHTPEHTTYLLLDGEQAEAAFSGGALMVGSVARTDLISPEQTEPLARAAFRSVRQRLATLPDDVPVYPTHGAGSFCSAPGGSERTTTIGHERATNPVFLARDEDGFVTSSLKALGTFPPYFLRLRDVNRSGPTVYGERPPVIAPIAVDDFRKRIGEGTVLIDVRPITDFAAGHVPGALSIELRPQFATWLGWLVPADSSMLFVLGGDQDRRDLIRQCLKIGYERMEGELDGGMEAWLSRGLPQARISLTLPGRVSGTTVDVRQESETKLGVIPGSIHAELGELERASLPKHGLTLYCGHGERAMTGASVLERSGRSDLTVLVGGPEDWARATGRPLEVDG